MVHALPTRAWLLALPLLAGCYIYDENPDERGVDPERAPVPACPVPPAPGGSPAPAPDAGARDGARPPASPTPPATSCPSGAVDRWKELLIVDPSVISSERANNAQPQAPWSFRTRLEQLAGPSAADLALGWLNQWRWVDSVAVTPGIPSAARVAVAPRPSVDSVLLCPWLQLDPANGCSADCRSCTDRRLPLAQAPFRLVAVVNRQDLATGSACGRDGGELRFVYTAVNPRTGAPLPFTVSFEYRVTLASKTRQGWAAGWRALGGCRSAPITPPSWIS